MHFFMFNEGESVLYQNSVYSHKLTKVIEWTAADRSEMLLRRNSNVYCIQDIYKKYSHNKYIYKITEELSNFPRRIRLVCVSDRKSTFPRCNVEHKLNMIRDSAENSSDENSLMISLLILRNFFVCLSASARDFLSNFFFLIWSGKVQAWCKKVCF